MTTCSKRRRSVSKSHSAPDRVVDGPVACGDQGAVGAMIVNEVVDFRVEAHGFIGAALFR